eukprot:scaffold662161_cov93-Prasinocladus_malaysianus.AAC.1
MTELRVALSHSTRTSTVESLSRDSCALVATTVLVLVLHNPSNTVARRPTTRPTVRYEYEYPRIDVKSRVNTGGP